MGLKYVMVTHWEHHWDKLPNNKTHFTKGMLKHGMTMERVRENTPTLFIKINKQTKKPEKAWEGTVYGFRYEENKIWFKVKIEKETSILPEYSHYSEGWYVEGAEEEIPFEAVNYPPFFYILSATKDWKEFEKYTHSLLKLLGIHQIFKFGKQRGEPDGFFKIGNLAVIYDTTLEGAFEEIKGTQIKNFCNMLKEGILKIMDTTIDISHCKKQVWIITKGTVRTLRKIDEIIIKEVPVSKLIMLYSERMEKTMDETELENKLRSL